MSREIAHVWRVCVCALISVLGALCNRINELDTGARTQHVRERIYDLLPFFIIFILPLLKRNDKVVAIFSRDVALLYSLMPSHKNRALSHTQYILGIVHAYMYGRCFAIAISFYIEIVRMLRLARSPSFILFLLILLNKRYSRIRWVYGTR